jgi:hypothetical protein
VTASEASPPSTLRPEQERALAYARRRGSEASLADIRGRVAATFAELDALLATVDAERARRAPPSGWCVQEVADHLLVSDRPAVEQLGELLAGRSPAAAIPASLQSAAPLTADWASLRGELAGVHAVLVALLDETRDDVPLAASAPVQMVVKCADEDGTLHPVQWLERFDWKAFAILLHAHNREHIAQVQRILAST